MKRSLWLSVCVLFLAASALALVRPPDEGQPLPLQTIEGTVETLVADDFETGHSEQLYHLLTDEGERIPLAFAEMPARAFKTGERLRVTGRTSANGRFDVELAEPTFTIAPESSAAAQSAWTTGPKRVLLIRYNFANDMSEPYPDATAQNVMFGATGSVAAFYAEGSYGLTTHTGSITPWLTVSSNKPTTCDISSYSQARTLATGAGYDPANYNLVVYVFPRIPCGWAGLGSVGGQGAWINQALSTYVVSHELGHNYGLLHAHSWDCSATYTLSPLESGSGLRALQLPTSVSGRTYWVEFRQATGFDSGLSGNANVMNGALIHLAPSAVG